MIRGAFSWLVVRVLEFGGFLESFCPFGDQVRDGVADAREAKQAREAEELFEFFDRGAVNRSAAPSPGAVSDGLPPTAPAPGHPYDMPPSERYRLDRFVQASNKFQK